MDKMTDNEYARMHGIPKAFRQYSKRYGRGIVPMVQMQWQIPAKMLDNGRDRKDRAAAKVLSQVASFIASGR